MYKTFLYVSIDPKESYAVQKYMHLCTRTCKEVVFLFNVQLSCIEAEKYLLTDFCISYVDTCVNKRRIKIQGFILQIPEILTVFAQ